MVCLGAGGIFTSGCSTTTVSSVDTPSKANQQVAGTKKPAANKKSATQVASKSAPGKVRISDLDDQTRVQMAAQIARQKAAAGAVPTVASVPSRGPATVGSGDPTVTPSAVENQQTAASSAVAAAQTRRPAASAAPKSRTANTVASNARTSAGNIRQTAGDGQSAPAIAKRSNITVPPTRPVITPRKTEWQPENGGEPVASSHERRRADRLMERAYAMYDNGFREEALRLASVAAELESSQQAVYKPGEERPSDFIVALATGSPGAVTPQSVLAERKTAAQKATDAAVARRAATARKRPAETRPATAARLADAAVKPQAAVDTEGTPAGAPHFSNGKESSIAVANGGKTDVPLPPSPRNADAALVTAEGNRNSLETASTSGDLRTVVTADRVEEAPAAGSPKILASATAAPPAPTADAAELEPLSESDMPAAAPASTSQLTIASLVGLLIGVGGMLGLGWWRRQERQHYAAPPKDAALRIRDADGPLPAKRRAA
jgi:hypothetical protein